MPLPKIFQAESVAVSLPAVAKMASAAARVDTREIAGYSREQQLQDQWCWAAVASSLAKFYNADTKWLTQCIVASAALGRNDCCATNMPAECNRWWYLDEVLTLTQNLRAFLSFRKSFEGVRDEINADRPLACRIGWFGGGGHFLVLAGYDASKRELFVKDPWHGDLIIGFDAFADRYQGNGTWTHSYETQAAPAILRASTGRRRAVKR